MEVQYRGTGKAFYHDKIYQCDLYYNEEQGGIVIKIHYMKNSANYFELPLEIDWLFGQLENGFKFLLFKLIRTNTQDMISFRETVYTYEAEYIFCGIGNEEEQIPTFNEACYTLSDIIEWGEVSIYEIGEKYELIKNESTEIVLYEDHDVTVSYRVTGNDLPVNEIDLLKENIELEQHGDIIIRTKEQEDFCYFISTFKKIQKLIELASVRKINVEKLIMYSDEIVDSYAEDFNINRTIRVYGKDILKPDEEGVKSTLRKLKWITLNELAQNNCIKNFMVKYMKLEPIVDLYQELFYTPVSNRTIFLNVVEALETYHSRFIASNVKKYKAHVDIIIRELPASKRQKTKKSLITSSSGKYIKLESRLTDLLIANYEFYFDTGDIKRADFPKVIAETRNYYIHYDESIKNKCKVLSLEELSIYNNVLISILDYYILKELGYKSDHVSMGKKLTERWGDVSQKLRILKQSKDSNNINNKYV